MAYSQNIVSGTILNDVNAFGITKNSSWNSILALNYAFLILDTGLFLTRSIVLPVVLYGCETQSLTLREERKLRVFEKMVLKRMFGPKREEVTGEWKRLHNEWFVLLTQYCAGDKIEKNEMGWTCGAYGWGEEGV